MFDIEYKGANCITISTKKMNFIFDPKLSVVGLKDVSVKNGVSIATEARFAVVDSSAVLQIEGPGEYEIAEVSVRAIRATRHLDTSSDEPICTMYRVEVGDVRIAVIGNIAPKLSEDQLESLGVVDLLVIPVGGNGYTLDAVSAATITRQIDPHVVIPVHYADNTLNYEVPQDNVDLFEKEIAATVEEVGPKYKVKASSSIPQVLTVVKIERS